MTSPTAHRRKVRPATGAAPAGPPTADASTGAGSSPAAGSGPAAGPRPAFEPTPEPISEPAVASGASGTAIGAFDVPTVLQLAVDEAVRLMDAAGSFIGLLDEGGRLRFAYESGMTESRVQRWRTTMESTGDNGGGLIASAIKQRRIVWTSDYPADQSFVHSVRGDEITAELDIRSIIAAPLLLDGRSIGAMAVYSDRPGAFNDRDVALARALADHAAAAIANVRLIERLHESEAALARRVEIQRSISLGGTRLIALRDPREVLEAAVDAAARLLDADGALLDLIDPVSGKIRWAYDSGITDEAARDILRALELEVGEGMFGRAIGEATVVVTGDYMADKSFVHAQGSDDFAKAVGMTSMVVAPLIGEGGPLGVIGIYAHRADAFGDPEMSIARSFATQATIAIANARLIDELASSRFELARRAETERALREITALRDPDVILQRVVDEARRLLRSDGSHLTFMSDDRTFVSPVVAAGVDDATREWMLSLEFPLGAGINGLAAQLGRPVRTDDYLVDPRIPHEPEDQYIAARLGIRSVAAVPLRAPAGEIIGTLAVSFRTVHEVDDESIDLLQVLGDVAAIAVSNSRLDTALRDSEANYRRLVENSPDLIWEIDADSRFTFLSDTCEHLTGWRTEQLLGGHFGGLVHPSSREVAEIDWINGFPDGSNEIRGRVNLLHRDGHPIPAEFVAVSRIEGGRFIGANGSVRDMSDRDRLEHELSVSEERYRFLVDSSPDIVFSVGADGTFTYLSESSERLLGWSREEIEGQHFTWAVDADSTGLAAESWAFAAANPGVPVSARLDLIRKDGSRAPFEVLAASYLRDGKFAGIQGSSRDVSDQDRLERDLRRQAVEIAAADERAHLARELHDSVTQALFSMTLLTRSVELLVPRDPSAALERLVTLRDLQRDALAEMRALIFELRPGGLEHDGLVTALRRHAAAVQGRLGLPVVFEGSFDERLPPEIEDCLYRIAQEALHNVVKHASATGVRLVIERVGPDVRLAVIDDGSGFDASAVPPGHLGLAGMLARAEKIGAHFTVTSAVDDGTTIEVVVLAAPVQ